MMQEEHKEGSSFPNWARQRVLLREALLESEAEQGERGSGMIEDVVGLVEGYLGKEFDGNSTQLRGHTYSVTSLCALSDGRLASGSWDKTV